jgi:hypothetical protein
MDAIVVSVTNTHNRKDATQMAKNTPIEPVEPTVPTNRKRLRTAGLIAGGILALGATFAAGAAVGDRLDGPRGGDFAAEGNAGPSGERGPQGEHDMGDRDRDGDRGMGHGPQGGPGGDRDGMHGPQGSLSDGSAPAPDVTP